MKNYAKYNAQNVLDIVNKYIDEKDSRTVNGMYFGWSKYDGTKSYYDGKGYYIKEVRDELSIFDWWNETLSASNLKKMRSFLKTAIELGYTGYVCFKVGASGCANGMWAHKVESTDGYSPDGEALYRSFSPDYTYWQVKDADGNWFPKRPEYNSCKTAAQVKKLVASI